jgi:hypothetical protein
MKLAFTLLLLNLILSFLIFQVVKFFIRLTKIALIFLKFFVTSFFHQSEPIKDFQKTEQQKREKIKKDLQTQKKAFQLQNKELKKAISYERKIGRYQATFVWFLILLLTIFFDDIKNTYLSWRINNQGTRQPKDYLLIVNTNPPNSVVKIMNVKRKYHSGIRLEPGKYILQIEHFYYFNEYRCITIKDHNISINVQLKKW